MDKDDDAPDDHKKEHGTHVEIKRTGKLFGGLINDLKRRIPLYRTDYTDACNIQCLFATLLVFLAQIVPALTFGAILGKQKYSILEHTWETGFLTLYFCPN